MLFSERTHPAPTVQRRKVIGSLGLAGLGLLVSSSSASAFTSGAAPKVTVNTQTRVGSIRTQQTLNFSDLPEEWVHREAALLPEYSRYLSRLNLKSICPKQVIEAHAKSKGPIWNCLPPKHWWTRMGYTLRVADRIALEMNVNQVEVISAYRSPAYNANCEGAKARSWHQANVALDLKFPVRASLVTSTARSLRTRGLFKGGVGGYWDFTHIDSRGENMDW
jgi:Peptidase M15